MISLPVWAEVIGYAMEKHCDQMHGRRPYIFHPAAVVGVLCQYGYCDDHELIAAAWLHDVVEDSDATIEDLDQRFGSDVAALVAAVTDEPGPTRAARKAETYKKIAGLARPTTLKVADRLANVACSSLKIAMYRSEHREFKAALYRPGMCDQLWGALDSQLERAAAA